MAYYMITKNDSAIFCDATSAAEYIADTYCDTAAAMEAYRGHVDTAADETWTAAEFADLKEDAAAAWEWFTYLADDLMDMARRSGSATVYGVTLYADAEAEALEARVADLLDPYCDEEAHVAGMKDLLENGGKMTVEALREFLQDAEPEEAAAAADLLRDVEALTAKRSAR